jgi:hypothetical protein
MSIIKDTFFGGAEKDAAKAQQKGIEAGIEATKEATAQARGDIGRLFPQAQASLTQGLQGAIDLFGQTVPQQLSSFQQGNIGAQQAILSGLPQMQNAILGGSVNLGGLQPFQVQGIDTGFLNQEVPGLREMYEYQAGQDYDNRVQRGGARALAGEQPSPQAETVINTIANVLGGSTAPNRVAPGYDRGLSRLR